MQFRRWGCIVLLYLKTRFNQSLQSCFLQLTVDSIMKYYVVILYTFVTIVVFFHNFTYYNDVTCGLGNAEVCNGIPPATDSTVQCHSWRLLHPQSHPISVLPDVIHPPFFGGPLILWPSPLPCSTMCGNLSFCILSITPKFLILYFHSSEQYYVY